jgi:hypothetical protein
MSETEEHPEPDADLDARALRAWLESTDPDDPDCDDVAMVVSDGDTTVRIVSGMGDRAQLARFGAERLSGVAQQFGSALAAREPKPNPRARSAVVSALTSPSGEDPDPRS